MNPRAVAAWAAASLCIALTTSNPVYRALVLLCALNVLVAHHRRDTHLRPLLRGVAAAGAVAVLLTVLLSHTGEHVLVAIPSAVPVVGGPLTVEAIAFGFSTALGIAAAVIAGAALSLVVEPHELVDALPRSLARSGAALGTALNLIPTIGRSAAEIRDAQRMRGWSSRRMRDWPDIAVPVVLTAIDSSMSLAEAMEARAYGTAARTHFHVTRWTALDVAVAACAVAAAGVFIALRVTGAAQDWYPFPALSAPGVDLAAAACCLLLAAPLLARRH